MRIGEVVGGAALVGVAVLVGIALTDDRGSRERHGGHVAVRVRRLDLVDHRLDRRRAATASTAPSTTVAVDDDERRSRPDDGPAARDASADDRGSDDRR